MLDHHYASMQRPGFDRSLATIPYVAGRPIAMPTLTFRIKKRSDGQTAVLTLVREDGSSTSGSIGRPEGYGPVHDLAHYVVERTLGLSEGFLGLIASGWAIRDFEKKGTARQLPAEAILAEVAAGEISRQAMMWQWSSAEDYAWAVETTVRKLKPGYVLPAITHRMFEEMRAELLALRQRWNEVAPGDALELGFTAGRSERSLRPEGAGESRAR